MEKIWDSALQCIRSYWVYLLVVLTIGFLIGRLSFKIIERGFIQKQKKRLENLENWIMLVSFMIALWCMFNAISGKSTQIESQYLSVYSSFVFAWILTKKTSGKDFKKNQHKIAKSTYRHIEDAETAVLIAKNRLMNQRGTELKEGDVDGLIDDLQIILTCIRSNKKDWRDMLKKKYRVKIDGEENPEDVLRRDFYNGTSNEKDSDFEEKMKSTFEEEIRDAQSK
ncbi:MAG: hypothetical protein K2G20_07200 [Lachnospiraceae bacterium]|nr:hypothetical protein [Lachnospiraceae bacterium]